MKKPWTHGPWVIASTLVEVEGKMFGIGGGKLKNGNPYFLAGVCQFEKSDKEEAISNATLIAIAPEMASAIMEWATMPNSKEDVEALEVKLNDLARRLLEIGGN